MRSGMAEMQTDVRRARRGEAIMPDATAIERHGLSVFVVEALTGRGRLLRGFDAQNAGEAITVSARKGSREGASDRRPADPRQLGVRPA
jgi:hypothetical protein